MQIAPIVDIGKRIHAEFRNERQKRLDRKHAMRVEFDALRTDRHGQIEFPALGDEPFEIGEALQMAFEIDRVAIAAEAKMLQRMQA